MKPNPWAQQTGTQFFNLTISHSHNQLGENRAVDVLERGSSKALGWLSKIRIYGVYSRELAFPSIETDPSNICTTVITHSLPSLQHLRRGPSAIGFWGFDFQFFFLLVAHIKLQDRLSRHFYSFLNETAPREERQKRDSTSVFILQMPESAQRDPLWCSLFSGFCGGTS